MSWLNVSADVGVDLSDRHDEVLQRLGVSSAELTNPQFTACIDRNA